MLELIALWAVAKRIGTIVESKGRKSGWYKFLTVVLWFGGELTGAVIGAIITGADESALCAVYLFALGGAAIGALTAYLIANSLSPAYPLTTPNPFEQQPPVPANRVARLNHLKKQLDAGRISVQEYETEKARILDEI